MIKQNQWYPSVHNKRRKMQFNFQGEDKAYYANGVFEMYLYVRADSPELSSGKRLKIKRALNGAIPNTNSLCVFQNPRKIRYEDKYIHEVQFYCRTDTQPSVDQMLHARDIIFEE